MYFYTKYCSEEKKLIESSEISSAQPIFLFSAKNCGGGSVVMSIASPQSAHFTPLFMFTN
jgi:hypothetical protein